MTIIIENDVTIIGGGIAGLWLFRRLNLLGYKALLLESDTLGGGQTIRSQGIIHGGIKYALSGNLTKASECIAGMPARWKACMAGTGELDLTSVETLSEFQYMWTPGGLASRLTTFFASKAMRGRVDPVSKKKVPEVFQSPDFKGKLYQLNEMVLDIPSVINALTTGLEDRTLKVDWNQDTDLKIAGNGEIETITCRAGDETYDIRSRRYVLTAGEGTGDLLQKWGLESPKMQLRPLHMVVMKHRHDYPLFAHCIGADIVPRMTVTSHPAGDGEWVWYLGGELAETGVKREKDEQIALAKKEVAKLLPWIDFGEAEWGTLRVNRAEPKQNKLLRPDAAFCKTIHNGTVTWPTKLALAPNLADEVIRDLTEQGIEPAGNEGFVLPDALPRPEITPPFWSGCFD